MLSSTASVQLSAPAALAVAGPLGELALPRFTRVIAVADVVESVRLMQEDEQGFIRRWHAFVAFVRAGLPAEGGRMHKSLGDGLMLEFVDAEGCIRTAVAMQQWFDGSNAGLPPQQQVQLRIGAHIAEFVADEHDIYGTDVNLTARIAGLAGPGEIVITAALRSQLALAAGEVQELGPCHLKHLDRPVLAYRLGMPGRPPLPPHAPGAAPLRAVLAVAPFRGTASSGEHGWMEEALADEALAALARSSELHLVSRLPAAQPQHELPGLDRSLRPHYVLRGRARRHGKRITLFAELADAASGAVVWARSFKGALVDLLHAEGRLAGELAREISAAVVHSELARSAGRLLPTLEAHTLLLAAIALMHRRTPVDMGRSRLMLEHLAERHRRQPAATAWLAYWHLLRLQQGASPDAEEDAQRAQDHCLASLQSDAGCALALCMDGYVRLHLRKDFEGAGERFGQVLSAWPENPLALLFTSERLALAGEGSLAWQAAQRALALWGLAPMRYLYEHAAAVAALAAGELRQACAFAESSLRANPAHTAGYRTLAVAQVGLGNVAQAQAAVRRLLLLEPGFTLTAFLRDLPAVQEVAQRQAAALAAAGAPR